MDIFEVLKAVLKRKVELIRKGLTAYDAEIRAEYDISKEYHISLIDIKRLSNGMSRNRPKTF